MNRLKAQTWTREGGHGTQQSDSPRERPALYTGCKFRIVRIEGKSRGLPAGRSKFGEQTLAARKQYSGHQLHCVGGISPHPRAEYPTI